MRFKLRHGSYAVCIVADGTQIYGRRVGTTYEKVGKFSTQPRNFTGFVFLCAVCAVRAVVR